MGKDACQKNLDELIGAILPGDDRSQVAAVTFGLSGVGRQAQRQTLLQIAKELGLTSTSVLTDAELLHFSAHSSGPGIALIAGTGSICLVSDGRGDYKQVGGWGFLLGDDGSGYDLGKCAVQSALTEHEDALGLSALTKAVLLHYGAGTPTDLISMVYAADNPQVWLASCARLVCDLAGSGEEHALTLVQGVAGRLIELCLRGTKYMSQRPPHQAAIFGGLLSANSPVRAAFMQSVRENKIMIDLVEPGYIPAAAAGMHAMQTAGHAVSDKLRQQLRTLVL